MRVERALVTSAGGVPLPASETVPGLVVDVCLCWLWVIPRGDVAALSSGWSAACAAAATAIEPLAYVAASAGVGDLRRAGTHCWQCVEPKGPVRGMPFDGCIAQPRSAKVNPRANYEVRTAAAGSRSPPCTREPRQLAMAALQSAANWAVCTGGTFRRR